MKKYYTVLLREKIKSGEVVTVVVNKKYILNYEILKSNKNEEHQVIVFKILDINRNILNKEYIALTNNNKIMPIEVPINKNESILCKYDFKFINYELEKEVADLFYKKRKSHIACIVEDSIERLLYGSNFNNEFEVIKAFYYFLDYKRYFDKKKFTELENYLEDKILYWEDNDVFTNLKQISQGTYYDFNPNFYKKEVYVEMMNYLFFNCKETDSCLLLYKQFLECMQRKEKGI